MFRKSPPQFVNSDLAHISMRQLRVLGLGSKSKHHTFRIDFYSFVLVTYRFNTQYAELFKLLNFFTLEDVAFYVEHVYPDAMQERLKVVMLWNIISFFVSVALLKYLTSHTFDYAHHISVQYDDISDIGPNLANPKTIKSQVVDTIKNGILFNPQALRPTEPLAAANHE